MDVPIQCGFLKIVIGRSIRGLALQKFEELEFGSLVRLEVRLKIRDKKAAKVN